MATGTVNIWLQSNTPNDAYKTFLNLELFHHAVALFLFRVIVVMVVSFNNTFLR